MNFDCEMLVRACEYFLWGPAQKPRVFWINTIVGIKTIVGIEIEYYFRFPTIVFVNGLYTLFATPVKNLVRTVHYRETAVFPYSVRSKRSRHLHWTIPGQSSDNPRTMIFSWSRCRCLTSVRGLSVSCVPAVCVGSDSCDN